MIVVSVTADDPRLVAFYRGIYLDEFAAQHEPLDVWQAALRGELPYTLTVRLALDPARDAIVGGIAFEHYPRSGCGLVTYMVVAPAARGQGLGEHLLRGATQELFERGAPAVFGEVNDPRVPRGSRGPDRAWSRLARFQRWGARVAATRYVQPALGPGLARDRGLVLIALAGTTPLPPALPGTVVRAFVEELYEVTEGGPPDAEVCVGDWVDLQSWDAPDRS